MTEVGNPVPEDVIPHLSPLGWEHITFTGSYHWREHASDISVIRPLRTFKLLDKKGKRRRNPTPPSGSLAQAIPLKERAEADRS
jgi:hypothetical protein